MRCLRVGNEHDYSAVSARAWGYCDIGVQAEGQRVGKAIRTKADLIITICRQWGMTFGQEMPVQLRCPSTFPHPFLVLFLLTAHYLPPPDLLYSHPFSRSFQRVSLESGAHFQLNFQKRPDMSSFNYEYMQLKSTCLYRFCIFYFVILCQINIQCCNNNISWGW